MPTVRSPNTPSTTALCCPRSDLEFDADEALVVVAEQLSEVGPDGVHSGHDEASAVLVGA